MEKTTTLWLLGQPVTFTVRLCTIEGCLQPLHKGPCKKNRGVTPGGKPGTKAAPKKAAPAKAAPKKTTAKKTTAKKAAPKKAPAKGAPAYSDADRVAQVKKMTAKPLHHGFKMDYIIHRLKKLADSFTGGDEKGGFDRDRMMVRITSKHGTGELLMTPQGWQTNITRHNSAPYTRNFKSVEDAALQLQGLRFFQPPRPEGR